MAAVIRKQVLVVAGKYMALAYTDLSQFVSEQGLEIIRGLERPLRQFMWYSARSRG